LFLFKQKAKDCVNPQTLTKFEFLKNEVSERMYLSKKSAPLGKVPKGNLPNTIDPNSFTFGQASTKCDSAKECVSPDKPRHIVELETSNNHDMYVYSHKDFEPGEQKNRLFTKPFDNNERFGVKSQQSSDGRFTKQALIWLPTSNLDKRIQSDSTILDNFREKHNSQIGKPLDPYEDFFKS
jgi:hypothetical protein